MERERRQEASDILDMVRSGIEAGVNDDHLTGCINDVLTCLIHSAVDEERETSAKILDGWALDERNRGELSKAECAEFAASCVRARTNRLITLNSGLGTAAESMVILNDDLIYYESVRERLEKWVFKPLSAMNGSQGFLVLMALLPLYERCLRKITGMKRSERFSENHRVYAEIASDLGITHDQAYRFWQDVRNMLMHWGGEEEEEPSHYNWGIEESGPMIQFEKDSFRLNPFALRNKLTPKILDNADGWDREFAFLPVSYHRRK